MSRTTLDGQAVTLTAEPSVIPARTLELFTNPRYFASAHYHDDDHGHDD